MKFADVVVAGDLFIDLILSGFDFWPEPGREALARDFAKEAGGGAAITACGLAKLGLAARVFGMVGADGDWLLQRLRGAGVDTAGIAFHGTEPTAFSVVASTAEDRAFLTYPGANRQLPEALRNAAGNGDFAGVRHVHLACAPELEHAPEMMDALRASGCTLSLDVGWHEGWLTDPRTLAVVQRTDVFFPNEAEALRMTGATDADAALQRFEEAGISRVALKRGANGALLLWDGQVYRCDPLAVRAVDVTGAGDCFNAGFLYAWLTGHSPRECLDAANFCGAMSTEMRGGIAGFPELVRLQEIWR